METNLEQAIDLVDELTQEQKEEIKQMVRNGKSVEILVTGKTGVGKSSLLNFILGKTIFAVSGSKDEPCTNEVHFEDSVKNGIKIRAWDSPGLQDGTDGEKYLKDMKEKCQKINLMLYCISMEEVRSDLHIHISAIHKINALFTKKVWRKTVFVLTFANARIEILRAKGKSDNEVKAGLEERTKQWREAIKETLRSLGVDRKVIDDIVVVPAGHPNEPHLPGCRYWLSSLWSKCLLSADSAAQAAQIKMEMEGGGFISEQDTTEEQIGRVTADERNIVFTPGVKLAIGVTVGGIVAAGLGIGAAIGGTIGALAIGIPSFGVAAGAGLGIGAAVGGAIGGGVAIGVGALIALYRRRKLNKED